MTTATTLEAPPIELPPEVQADWIRSSPKQQKFILNYLMDPTSITRAYQSAGYGCKGPDAAYVAARRLLVIPRISKIMYALLRAHRLTPEFADLKLTEGLEARETRFFATNGTVDKREVIAWDARLKALDMLYKLQGRYRNEHAPQTVVINIVQATIPPEQTNGHATHDDQYPCLGVSRD